MIPTRIDAYRLMHQGALALAEVEAAGMRIDVSYLTHTIAKVSNEINSIESDLKSQEEYRAQSRRFGQSCNVNSRYQLAKVLSENLGFKLESNEETGREKLDESSLEKINTPYAKKFLRYEKLLKLRSTYLEGILRETVDGFLHPFFDLNFATTYRSNSSIPNLQNIPMRDPEMAALIRPAFIPRNGHVLVEADYSALEFKVASSFWKSNEMIQYASDPDKDIHRDCAAEIFMCDRDQVDKKLRYQGKNGWVFPQIYGSYYADCARNIWEGCERMGLEVKGIPTRKWLRRNGVVGLGPCDGKTPVPATFEWHLRKFENRFYRWFPGLKESQEAWWGRYKKNGYFDLMTGFRISGVYSKNFLYNAPIQGPAFHLLLWSLIRMVRWLMKNRFKTKIIAEIHDSIMADVHRDELDQYLGKIKEVMTQKVKEYWDWILTPLGIEAKMSEQNWFTMRTIEI